MKNFLSVRIRCRTDDKFLIKLSYKPGLSLNCIK